MLLLKVPLLVWEMNIILQDNKKKQIAAVSLFLF